MTNEKALKIVRDIQKSTWLNSYKEAAEIAMEALEKQIPKKIVITNGDDCCPSCNYVFGADSVRKTLRHWDVPFCKKCGQRLDWGENNVFY